jgi:magnesium transporter
VLAGIGGMSEFTMMTEGVPWPIAYGSFSVALITIGWMTFAGLRFFENRKVKNNSTESRRE